MGKCFENHPASSWDSEQEIISMITCLLLPLFSAEKMTGHSSPIL
ncbi:hypothetical protein CLOSTMETH_01643 [[Clostridium] methylpentosum DSM 5476]|uniref:Uncharacterized protein n=1 Tax=[Clostridium] methylpentosum DSM 5476 TaxID=537013 RepID=C0ECS2_9FIRM|nr:hypothetical protein CLOSTMETH_01643 [[Clostridium] methylpentosum DSM 5476]